VVSKWEEVLQQVSENAEWVAATERLGAVPRVLSPAETTKFVEEQYNVYYTLADRLGLRVE
jgi:tripartite-type tricarboxylate transporter receptor subunit TctC